MRRARRATRAVVTIFACLAASCTPAATSVPPARSTAATEGAALYAQFCAVCHGPDGRTVEGVTAPNLNNQALLTLVDDAFLRESIARGRPGTNGHGRRANKMSVYARSLGGPLDDAQIDSLVAHLRSWQTDPPVQPEPFTADGDAAAGREVYAVCVACHQPDGWSTIAPSLAGSTFQAIASDAFIRHMVLNGRPGTTMPAFKLSDEDLADLIAFIRTLDDASATAEPDSGR